MIEEQEQEQEQEQEEYTADLFAEDAVSEDTELGDDLTAAFEAVEGADAEPEEVANLEDAPASAPSETVPPDQLSPR